MRGDEGFLVSVGPRREAAALREWVMCRFQDYGQRPAAEWSVEDRAELAQRAERVNVWARTESGNDLPTPLRIDPSRLEHCIEAWIPVTTPLGAGWFLGPNSD